ncbi:MAG TPA: D-alanyl-D-alanine carboxypeptidase/D-alanyl-D-alanine-endopeptidase [Coleofasciculaceae cyanobacterium]
MNWRSLIAILPSLSFLLLSISTEVTTGQEIAPKPTLSDRNEQTASQSICPSQLGTAIEAITQRPEFARSRWGILVETLSTANRLYSRDAEQYFIPASNVKLLITAAALRQLSPQFRIRTSVYGTGTLPNLTSLRVVGRGDPSLTTAQLEDLAQQLKRRGVRQVEHLIVDNSYFRQAEINPTWEWEDIQYNYATSTNSLILNQNTVTLTLSPQQSGQPLQLNWNDTIAAKQWRVENQSVTATAGTENSVTLMGVLGQPLLKIKGQLAADAQPDSWDLAILNPAQYFLDSFRQSLLSEGITVTQASIIDNFSVMESMQELAAIESPSLAELVKETNQQSNNLYAEVLLRILETEGDRTANPDDGLAVLKQRLTELGINPEGYHLMDGAGLSRHNLVSPDAIAQTLQRMAQTPQATIYRASLPVAGVSGTLENRFRNTAVQSHLQAKTGTLTGVSALSGYLDVPAYQPLVLSIIVNQSEQSIATLRQGIDEIVLLLPRLRSC